MQTNDLLRIYLQRARVEAREARRGLDESRARIREPIAVIGMGSRVPGGSTPDHLMWRVPTGGAPGSGLPDDLPDMGGFDAAFFDLGPEQARAVDPRLRVLLEVAWETLEYAGLEPLSLRNIDGGVFIGVSGTNVAGGLAANLRWSGPAISIDAACSASLVAIHLAVHALRGRECAVALAGGVSVRSGPDADRTGLTEGAGLLVLERLTDAVRLGHHIYAVIRGTAVNQDVAAAEPAQAESARSDAFDAALADAGLSPTDVDLGAVTSTSGGAQAADGMAGTIATVLALHRQQLPQTRRPWPATDQPRRAAVYASAGGSRAQLVLEEPPPGPDDQPAHSRTPPHPVVLPLATRTPDALRESAGRLHRYLTAEAGDPATRVDLAKVTHALSARTAFRHRAVIVADDHSTAVDALHALATGHANPSLITGCHRPAGPTAFLFAGEGTQHHRMGMELHQQFPVFARCLDDVCAVLDPHLEQPLRDVLFAAPGHPIAHLLHQVQYTRPALFAYQTALCRLLRYHGVHPDVLVGHSAGDVTAAHIAGVLTLADAATLVTSAAEPARSMAPAGAPAVRALAWGQPSIPVISAVTGAPAVYPRSDPAAYWVEHRRGSVQYHRAIAHLHAEHPTAVYFEIGADGNLSAATRQLLPSERAGYVHPVQRPGTPQVAAFYIALARAHTTTHTVAFSPAETRHPTPPHLPTYPFDHRTRW
jgi:acyl transferase domain-containing protein